MYETVKEAMMGLREVEMDVAADRGEEAVEVAWGDLVHSVAECITDSSVKAQFLQRNGMVCDDC